MRQPLFDFDLKRVSREHYITGKTAIITGAGRAVLKDGSCGSIGYGIATAYAKEGANLVITGRNVKKLESAKQELESLYGIKVLTVQRSKGRLEIAAMPVLAVATSPPSRVFEPSVARS